MVLASGPVPAVDAPAGDSGVRRYTAQVAAVGGLLGVGVMLAYGSLKIPFICPLRAITGVPCPMCGMTTGTTAFIRGDLRAAAAANPLSLVFVPGLVALLADRAARIWRRSSEVVVSPRARRWLVRAVPVMAVGSWLFQLSRFGLIG